ncbi:MAG TPA: bifunctional ornithine acetyltransferase/N-acetylglutamate synthase, partial [archaeon]|nr:bifunctional ornithine acetyltransferase/N-acetylglutamate synthase [archaeon]
MVMIVSGSLDSVPGFHTAGTSCGIKEGGKPDLGVLLCDVPCCAAGVFTTNRVQAAPVIYSKNILSRNAHAIRGIVANSGNANACTGERGLRDAAAVAAEAERIFSLPEGSLLVMSTGVIGKPLPVEKLKAGLGRVQEQFITGSSGSFASAIMTTDTKEKSLALKFEIEGVPIKLGAAAKGAGMIHPDMA